MIYWATLSPHDGGPGHRPAAPGGAGRLGLHPGAPGLCRRAWRLVPREAVLFDSVTACLACQMFSGPQPDAAARRPDGGSC